MTRLSVETRDGTRVVRDVRRMPRFWKSWLLQQLPYGYDTLGIRFKRERV